MPFDWFKTGGDRGVYSSRKSESFPSAKHCLQNPSPTSKLQVPPNQEPRSVFFTFFCNDLLGGGVSQCQMLASTHKGCLRGDVPPSEAGKFVFLKLE